MDTYVCVCACVCMYAVRARERTSCVLYNKLCLTAKRIYIIRNRIAARLTLHNYYSTTRSDQLETSFDVY